MPEVLRVTFQLLVTCGGSLKFNVVFQPLTVLLPLLVTFTFN